jgi:hypothetical protein
VSVLFGVIEKAEDLPRRHIGILRHDGHQGFSSVAAERKDE